MFFSNLFSFPTTSMFRKFFLKSNMLFCLPSKHLISAPVFKGGYQPNSRLPGSLGSNSSKMATLASYRIHGSHQGLPGREGRRCPSPFPKESYGHHNGTLPFLPQPDMGENACSNCSLTMHVDVSNCCMTSGLCSIHLFELWEKLFTNLSNKYYGGSARPHTCEAWGEGNTAS